MAFVAPVVEHWLEQEIAQWIDPTIHHTMSERSYRGATSRSSNVDIRKKKKEMFYLTMHSTHFIYGYMASDIW